MRREKAGIKFNQREVSMGLICPYCDAEISEREVEAEDGCCPECGALISATDAVEDEEENEDIDDDDEFEDDDDFRRERGKDPFRDAFKDIDDDN